MTQDYKLKLLKWFVGDYQTETGVNTPQFSQVEEVNSNFKTAIETAFPNGYDIVKILQAKDGKGNGTKNVIVVGYEAGSPIKGFILIMDEEYNIIKTFRKYNDGSDIRMFLTVNMDEKGCLYGIEGDSVSTNLKLVLMNNITAVLPGTSDYVLIKRESYSTSGIAIENIKKAPGKDYYTTAADKLSVIKISGSSANITNYSVGNGVYIFDYIPSWDNADNFSMTGIGVGNSNKYYNVSSNGTTTLQTTQISGLTASSYGTNAYMVDNGDKYIINAATNTSSYFNYELFRVSGNTANKIHTDTCQWTSVYNLFPNFYDIKSDDAFFYVLIDFDQANPTKYVFTLNQVVGDDVYSISLGEVPYDNNSTLLGVGNTQNQFNLYEIFFQADDKLFKVGEIFNPQNYNGQPYQDYDSLVPNSVNMYDTDDNVIFSRNLYNKVISNNTVTSTVVIPNSFLNNIPIELKELVGKTNVVLENDSEEIEKNIYEEVYVNFSNTIKILNENDVNNPIYNESGASKIQNSVSDTNDYNNSKIGKAKVNYTDNTSDIYQTSATGTYSGISTQITFGISTPADKDITSIELLSNDGLQTYQTITGLNLERNKMYLIKQKVEVL